MRLRSLTAGLAVVLVLAGCAAPGEPPAEEPALESAGQATAADDPLPEGAEEFYAQDIAWEPCEGEGQEGLQCGDVRVPMDWANAGGRELTLAVIRQIPNPDDQATIWMNPGGPGGSGVETLSLYGESVVSPELDQDFTLASFDPRGIGESAPVECLPSEDFEEYITEDVEPETDAGMDALLENGGAFVSACEQNSGALLPFLGTRNAARDLDVIRAASGAETLDYLGLSYGTLLGAVYADYFPTKVGRFVLDGGIDPSLSGEELVRGQAEGFEDALGAFVEYCLGSSECPLDGTVDEAKAQLVTVLERTQETPIPLWEGRSANEALLARGVIGGLYADETWDYLLVGLQSLIDDNDASTLVELADGMDQRDENGYNVNFQAANSAVNCLDYSFVSDPEAMRQEAEALDEAAPSMGRYVSYSGAVCGQWPTPPQPLDGDIDPSGAAQALVVGTRGDPATPYEWSQSLAEAMGAPLLTYEGEGHVAYPRGGPCVTAVVDDYFREGYLPAAGATC